MRASVRQLCAFSAMDPTTVAHLETAMLRSGIEGMDLDSEQHINQEWFHGFSALHPAFRESVVAWRDAAFRESVDREGVEKALETANNAVVAHELAFQELKLAVLRSMLEPLEAQLKKDLGTCRFYELTGQAMPQCAH